MGAQNASLQMQLVTEQLAGANPVAIGDITVGVMELKSGNIEALAVAYGNAEMIVDANPDLVIAELPPSWARLPPTASPVAKGDPKGLLDRH